MSEDIDWVLEIAEPTYPEGDWVKLGWMEKPFSEWDERMAGFSPAAMKVLKEQFPTGIPKGLGHMKCRAEGSTIRYAAYILELEHDGLTYYVKHYAGWGGPHGFVEPSDEVIGVGPWTDFESVVESVKAFIRGPLTEAALAYWNKTNHELEEEHLDHRQTDTQETPLDAV